MTLTRVFPGLIFASETRAPRGGKPLPGSIQWGGCFPAATHRDRVSTSSARFIRKRLMVAFPISVSPAMNVALTDPLPETLDQVGRSKKPFLVLRVWLKERSFLPGSF